VLHVACWAQGEIKLSDPSASRPIDGVRDSAAAVDTTSLLTRGVFSPHSCPVRRCLPLLPRLTLAAVTWSEAGGGMRAMYRICLFFLSRPLSPPSVFFLRISFVFGCRSVTPPSTVYMKKTEHWGTTASAMGALQTLREGRIKGGR